jgi:hypothetical protein
MSTLQPYSLLCFVYHILHYLDLYLTLSFLQLKSNLSFSLMHQLIFVAQTILRNSFSFIKRCYPTFEQISLFPILLILWIFNLKHSLSRLMLKEIEIKVKKTVFTAWPFPPCLYFLFSQLKYEAVLGIDTPFPILLPYHYCHPKTYFFTIFQWVTPFSEPFFFSLFTTSGYP